MTEGTSTVDRLRRAFAALDDKETPEGGCLEPGKLWDAAHARLAPRDARAVVQHVAVCPACAADWRVAMRSGEEPARPRIPHFRWAPPLALAATLAGLAVLALFRLGSPQPVEPTYRQADVAIRSLLSEGARLPRDGALLRWTPVSVDAVYFVEVGKPDLTPLASAHDLREAEYLIPRDSLEQVANGETIVWRVEALLPDGRRFESEAFLNPVE